MKDDTPDYLIKYPTIRNILTGTIVVLVGVIVTTDFLSSIRRSLLGAFPSAGVNETLIVVAPFMTAKGVTESLVHREIKISVEDEVERLGLSDQVRIEEFPISFLHNNKDKASDIMETYDADLIIWGDITTLKTYVSYLGRGTSYQLDFSDPNYAGSRITQKESDEYTTLITNKIPRKSKFFALYAISYAYTNIDKIDKAIQVLENASEYEVSTNPSNYKDLKSRLSYLHFKKDRYPKAITFINDAMSIYPNSASLFNQRGLYYMHAGKVDSSLQDFSKAIEHDSSALYFTNRGVARVSAGDSSGALSDFNSAIKLDPTSAQAYNMRGAYKAQHGNPRSALDDYNKAISIAPNLAWAYRHKGIAHKRLGNILTAHDYFTKAIRINSNNPNVSTEDKALFNRGLSHLRLEYEHQAINDLTRVINNDSSMVSAYRKRAIAYRNMGHLTDALKDYNKVIQIEPEEQNNYIHRGRLHMANGDMDDAESDFKKAINLDSDDFLPHQNLASLYFKNGLEHKALKKYNDAASIKPNAYIYATRGIIYARLGCTKSAQEDLRKAISYDTHRARWNISILQAKVHDSRYINKDCELNE